MTKLEKACEMSLNEWLATIPDDVPEAEYTENHEKWLKKLFNKMRDNRYHRFTTKTVKVLLVAAVLAALLLTAFVIPSSREYIVDNFEIFSRYQLTESNDNSVNGKITVGYIPEGFELINKQNNLKSIIYDYYDINGQYITVSKFPASTEIDFNTEHTNTETIVIRDITYIYCISKDDKSNIIWNKNDYIYQVNGNISKDEIIKIAEKVE